MNTLDEERFLCWNKFSHPDESAAIYVYLMGGLAHVIDSWWIDDFKAESLTADVRA